MRLTTRINLGFSLTFIAVFVTTGVFIGTQIYTTIKDQTFKQLNEINNNQAEIIRDITQEHIQVVKTILEDENIVTELNKGERGDVNNLIMYVDMFKRHVDEFEGITLLDSIGNPIISTVSLTPDRDQVILEQAKKGTLVTNTFIDETSKELVYEILSPTKTGEILAVQFKDRSIQKTLQTVQRSYNTSESFLINKDYYLISTTKYKTIEAVMTEKVQTQTAENCITDPANISPHHTKGGVYTDYRGIKSITAHTYINGLDWCLISRVDLSEIYTPWYELLKVLGTSALVAIVFILISGYILSKRIAVPILKLTDIATNIESGNFKENAEKIDITQQDEIGVLARAIKKMLINIQESTKNIQIRVKEQTAELSEKTKSLEEQQLAVLNILEDVNEEKEKSTNLAQDLKKFELAVEYASDHIVITNAEGIILYANKAVTGITGFSTEEVIGKKAGGKELWGGLMTPETYKTLWHTIKEEKKPFWSELRNKRKNGEEYTADAHITPVLNGSGEVIFFVGIERDITKAKEIDRMKTEFISLASHQLRTPLSAMKWFLEMLLNGDAGNLTKEQKQMVENVDKSNERMLELVSALLNISRIESGRIIIEPKPTDLGQLINEVMVDLAAKIKEKKQTPIVSIHSGLKELNIDPKLVRNVYMNLLTNAIKYSPEKSEISVMVSKKGNEILSQVSDSGVGIPKEDQAKIFNKFYRASNVLSMETDGTGLGLYLVKAIVESSGGKIWFESKEGKGTSFWFTLPVEGMKPKKGEVSLDI